LFASSTRKQTLPAAANAGTGAAGGSPLSPTSPSSILLSIDVGQFRIIFPAASPFEVGVKALIFAAPHGLRWSSFSSAPPPMADLLVSMCFIYPQGKNIVVSDVHTLFQLSPALSSVLGSVRFCYLTLFAPLWLFFKAGKIACLTCGTLGWKR